MMGMRRMIGLGVLAGLTWTCAIPAKDGNFLGYSYDQEDLPNGLRLITVPLENPHLVALYLVVQTGSRNEVEPGKSGFAHLFEHMMFRGSQHFSPEQRDAILKRAGAASNAYTSDDRTVYHEVFSNEDLERVMELEADRFQRLQYSRELYQTETTAVLGEYNKNSSDPREKLFEVVRETAFTTHPYRHTTMGFLADIQNMPREYDYSLEFYRRYYRPEYTTLILAGDVTPARALALTQRYFGGWQRGDFRPAIRAEPPPTAPRTAHLEWPSPTLPMLWIAFRGPAYSDEQKDKAALDLLATLTFGENSVLYQKLVLQEQKLDELSPAFDDQIDPELFSVVARIKHPQDVAYVQAEILAAFQRCCTELIPPARLEATRSRLRYGTSLGLVSAEAVAAFLAPYVALRRSPETIDKLFALYHQLTPEDLRQVANRYFQETGRTIVTLTSKADNQTKASHE
jgi:zinc protease